MDEEKRRFHKGLKLSILLVLSIWLVKFVEIGFNISFVSFGVLPREFSGLPGILLFPFIHSDFEHLISNSFPILFLVTAIFYFYPTSASKVMLIIYIFSGLLVWLIGRQSYHIGASGFVYGLVAFTFFSGIIRWDRRSIVLSLIVTFLYGGFTWKFYLLTKPFRGKDIYPEPLVGIACAFLFRKNDPYDKFAGMEEEEFEIENDHSI
ncbi:MAG: rhomboid family intramembrane serine protease [Melioribacteraceae bacterium]|nr:rhomboid family intramembrane serine protease [Melioribacteraceae bacterium]